MELVTALSFDIDPASRPSRLPDRVFVHPLLDDHLIVDDITNQATLHAALTSVAGVRRARSGFRVTLRAGRASGAIAFALAPWSGGELDNDDADFAHRQDPCRWGFRGRRVCTDATGHFVEADGVHLVSQPLAKFLRSIGGPSTTASGCREWRRLGAAAPATRQLHAMSSALEACLCGRLVRCRSDLLVARARACLDQPCTVDALATGHDRTPTIVLSPQAAKDWSRQARSGYELVPVYPQDGPVATQLRQYQELLDRHIPVAGRSRR